MMRENAVAEYRVQRRRVAENTATKLHASQNTEISSPAEELLASPK
jgi:hypothetical protein